ncbi:MAG: hypothetical protein HGB19_13065 [Chlorobiales bacterium]|jgi:hypothetical protein|nr:hypothetical protein [Chlorobiales bacterium]
MADQENVFGEQFSEAINNVTKAMGSIGSLHMELLNKVSGAFGGVLTPLVNTLTGLIESFTKTISQSVDNITAGLKK